MKKKMTDRITLDWFLRAIGEFKRWTKWLYENFDIEQENSINKEKNIEIEIRRFGESCLQVKILKRKFLPYRQHILGFYSVHFRGENFGKETEIKEDELIISFLNGKNTAEYCFINNKKREMWIAYISRIIDYANEVDAVLKKTKIWKPKHNDIVYHVLFRELDCFHIYKGEYNIGSDDPIFYKYGLITETIEEARKIRDDLNKLINNYLDENNLRRE